MQGFHHNVKQRCPLFVILIVLAVVVRETLAFSLSAPGLLQLPRCWRAQTTRPLNRRVAPPMMRLTFANNPKILTKVKSVQSRLALASVLETINIQEFDSNGKGQLDIKELRAALRSRNVILTEYEFMGLLRAMDRNVDGFICKEDIDATIQVIRGESNRHPESILKVSSTKMIAAKDQVLSDIAARTDAWRESSRKYSRTVFEAKDWLRYRRSTRLIEMVLSSLESGVLRALWFDISVVVMICSALLVYNHGIEDGYLQQALSDAPAAVQNFVKHLPVAKIPLSAFTITSPALGLLLVFRTNGSFQRFFEARAVWGGVINYCRTMTRQALFYMDDPRYIEEATRRTIVFARALKLHLRYDAGSESVARQEFQSLIGSVETEKLLAATHRPCQALADLASVIRRANLDPHARRSFDVTLENFSNQLGACERIFKTPLPLVYTRHTARFLTLWVLTLPLAMYSELKGSLMLIPIMAVIAAFKLGIEELGVQITEPFSILPLENMCDGIEASCTEMIKRGAEKALTNDQPYAFFASHDAREILPQKLLGLQQTSDQSITDKLSDAGDVLQICKITGQVSMLVDPDDEVYPQMDKNAMINIAKQNVEKYSSTTYEDIWRLGMEGFSFFEDSLGYPSEDADDEDQPKILNGFQDGWRLGLGGQGWGADEE